MNKAFKILIDRVTNTYFFRVWINDFTSRIIWKNVLETCCAVSIIALWADSRVKPIDTVRAPRPSTMFDTFISYSYCALLTVRFNTSLSSTMRSTFFCRSSSTLITSRFHASRSSTMFPTRIGFSRSTIRTAMFYTSCSSTMCFTSSCSALSTLRAFWFYTSWSTAMCFTFISIPLCILLTISFYTHFSWHFLCWFYALYLGLRSSIFREWYRWWSDISPYTAKYCIIWLLV